MSNFTCPHCGCNGQKYRDEIERNRKEINGLIELLRKDRAEIERLRAAVKAAEKAFLQDGDVRGAALMRAALEDDDD